MALRFQQKLTIPVASRPLVHRSELATQIDQAITTCRLVVLAAPAGWGKTTVLAEWATNAALPVAWYTLDTADHDPQRFLDYLLHTVTPFVPGAAELAARLDSSLPQNLFEVAHEAALLIADAPEPFALVLDDLQLLTDGPELPGSPLVLDLLASVVEYASNCHVILASRTVPDLRGLVRLIAQQRAAVFDYMLLQFSVDEVQHLARLNGGVQLATAHAEQLTTQFGGWVTGIVLSLDRSIHSHYQSNFDGVTDTGKVYAYFAEQVVAPLAPDFQRFLEATSVLEDLSPERCDRLRDAHDSQEYLDLTLRYSLFVSSRGDWLTYHSLFRDFLRTRLYRDAQRSKQLLLRAAELYREEDDIARALECYLSARAEAQAIAMLREAVPRFRQRSLHTTIIACFNQLGQDVLLPADLLIEQARVYSDLALWDQALVAITLAETIGDETASQEAQIAHADLHYLMRDFGEAQTILDEVRDRLMPALRINYALVASRLQLAQGEVAAAIEGLEGALRLIPTSQRQDGPSLTGTLADMLGLAYARQGERTAAQRYLRRADACWRMLGNTGRRAMTLNNLGMLAFEERRYPEARAAFEQGLENARHTTRRRTETTLLCSLAELDLSQGDTTTAMARFDEAYTLAARLYIVASASLAAVGVWWVAIIAGDEVLARRWTAAALEGSRSASADVHCRALLARNRAYRLGILPDSVDLAAALAEVAPYHTTLAVVDQVEFALQQAAIAFEQEGWPAAEGFWHDAEVGLHALNPTLQQQLIAPYLFLTHQAQHSVDGVQAGAIQIPNTSPAPAIESALDHWHVTTLGVFTCRYNEANCELSSIYQTLLTRLLDAGPAGLAVDRLWESVWGDTDLSMTALHQALRRLRAQTGLAVSARDGMCAIRSPWHLIDYDVRDFERDFQGTPTLEALEHAVALYRGEFLPSAPLSAALWVTARRSYLQQRYLDALEQLGQAKEDSSPQTALNYYQQILQIDSYREQTAVRLMRLAAQAGNRSLVNATYEHLILALRTLGATPSGITQELYRQLV